jgi:hypothetical protein
MAISHIGVLMGYARLVPRFSGLLQFFVRGGGVVPYLPRPISSQVWRGLLMAKKKTTKKASAKKPAKKTAKKTVRGAGPGRKR